MNKKEFVCDSSSFHVYFCSKEDLKIKHKKAKPTPAFML
jgi:hypothetical protein